MDFGLGFWPRACEYEEENAKENIEKNKENTLHIFLLQKQHYKVLLLLDLLVRVLK